MLIEKTIAAKVGSGLRSRKCRCQPIDQEGTMPCLPRDWMSGFITVTLMAVGGVLLSLPCVARAPDQEPPPPPAQVLPEPMMDENTGFKSIFDGKTLKDWDGDPQYWRVENGAIV